MIDSLNQGNESKRNVQHNSTADQQRGTRTIARKGYPRLNHLRTLDFSVQWDGIQAHKKKLEQIILALRAIKNFLVTTNRTIIAEESGSQTTEEFTFLESSEEKLVTLKATVQYCGIVYTDAHTDGRR